jgi:hypothetical protein
MLCPSLAIKFNKTALLQGNGQAMSDLYGDAVAEWPVGSRCILLAGSFFLWIFHHHAARIAQRVSTFIWAFFRLSSLLCKHC